jgi:hypothetical protein
VLNPAFMGAILRKAVEGYVEHVPDGMPFELVFLVPAFALHPKTNQRLPVRAASTPLHMWIQRDENRDVLVALSDRLAALVPFVREAIIFAAQRNIITFATDGRLKPGERSLHGISSYRNTGEEIKEGIRLGEFVGRWLALAGSPATIYTLLGVRP